MSYLNLNDEFKDKGLKLLVRLSICILIIVFIILSIITIQKIRNNEHVKVFGIEFNIPVIPEKQKLELPQKDSIPNKPNSKKSEPTQPIKKKSLEVKNKKDTLKTSPIITGKNINLGTNYGHIGDVNVNERELTEADKIGLINYIESVKKKYNFNPNCIFMASTSNSNGGKVASQIEEYLVSRGYIIGSRGNEIGLYVKGVVIDKFDDCIKITVGTL